jgi:electron transfer flavoprotein alpha subunit
MRATVRALIPLELDEEVDPLSCVAAAAPIAKQAGAHLVAVIAGRVPDDAMAQAAFRLGADSVDLISHGQLADPAPVDQWVEVFAHVLVDPDHAAHRALLTLLPAGAAGEEIAARLAVRLGGAALGRCASIEIAGESLIAKRAAYGGRASATLRCETNAFAALRAPETLEPQVDRAGTSRRIALSIPLLPAPPIERRDIGGAERRLEGARVIVSGGRGMAGPEGFELLRELAASLGAALGGSLPTVDAGWIPVARQVGQSGKFVAPEIYVAVGISGTPQHLAGIGPHARIVAINKDAEADIFRVAELGVVGDWKDVLPALVQRLREAQP